MLSHYEWPFPIILRRRGRTQVVGREFPGNPPLEYWYNILYSQNSQHFHLVYIPRDLHSSLSFLFRFPDTDKLSPPILQLSDVMMYTCMHTCISFPVFVLCVFSACFIIFFFHHMHMYVCYVCATGCLCCFLLFCICLHEKHAQMYVCTCMSYSVFLQVAFGYEKNIVFKNMNISADMETRIALVSHSMETASTVELL